MQLLHFTTLLVLQRRNLSIQRFNRFHQALVHIEVMVCGGNLGRRRLFQRPG
jgi:hypothetical protein